jgi:predicted nucleic acid-binding protein
MPPVVKPPQETTPYILDSNIIMLHLNKKLDLDVFFTALPSAEKCISIVTFIEVLAKPGMTAEDETKARAFLADYTIIDINPTIRETAIMIRRIRKLRLPDSIIAATAVSLNALMLSNDPHLSNLLWPGYHAQTIL